MHFLLAWFSVCFARVYYFICLISSNLIQQSLTLMPIFHSSLASQQQKDNLPYSMGTLIFLSQFACFLRSASFSAHLDVFSLKIPGTSVSTSLPFSLFIVMVLGSQKIAYPVMFKIFEEKSTLTGVQHFILKIIPSLWPVHFTQASIIQIECV